MCFACSHTRPLHKLCLLPGLPVLFLQLLPLLPDSHWPLLETTSPRQPSNMLPFLQRQSLPHRRAESGPSFGQNAPQAHPHHLGPRCLFSVCPHAQARSASPLAPWACHCGWGCCAPHRVPQGLWLCKGTDLFITQIPPPSAPCCRHLFRGVCAGGWWGDRTPLRGRESAQPLCPHPTGRDPTQLSPDGPLPVLGPHSRSL